MEENNIKVVPSQKSIYDDDIFKIPYDKVTLPSGGKLYGDKIQSVIDVEYVVAKDEDILYSSELIDTGIMFNVLVSEKIKDKSINIDDLLVGDFNEILLFLRKSAYGSFYNINTFDPDTREVVKKPVDLDILKRKKLEVTFDELGEFDFVLPIMNKRITFKLPTVGMMNIINNRAEQLRDKRTNVAPFIKVRLETQIMSIEGNRDKTYISRFVNVVPPRDRLAFMQYIESIEPGVDLNYTFKSQIKENEYSEKLIFGYDFFYPTSL